MLVVLFVTTLSHSLVLVCAKTLVLGVDIRLTPKTNPSVKLINLLCIFLLVIKFTLPNYICIKHDTGIVYYIYWYYSRNYLRIM